MLQTYVIWNSNIPYVPPRHTYNCIVSTVPPHPYPVENFTVTACSINDSTISLLLEWSPTSIVNGELDSYDVCVGSEPLEPDEEISSNTTHDCSSYNVCYCKLIFETIQGSNSNYYVLYTQRQIISDMISIQMILNSVYIQVSLSFQACKTIASL